MASPLRAAFPSGPMTDQAGELSPAWRGFFNSLYARTGSANGIPSVDTAALEAELEAEREARIAADQALSTAQAAEAAARQQADTSEATARRAADTAEANSRQASDALLMPLAGTTTNDNAPAGQVGEFIAVTNPGVALTTSTVANIAAITLSAGDWNLTGYAGTAPSAGTTAVVLQVGLSSSPAAFAGSFSTTYLPFTAATGAGVAVSTPAARLSLAATTQVYLLVLSAFSGGTSVAYGSIGARRAR